MTDRNDELRVMAQAWRDHLQRSQNITFAPTNDLRRYVLAAGSQIGRWFGLKTGEFAHMLDNVSFTLPSLPGLWEDPVVLMSRRSQEDPLEDIETATHEATHGRDLRAKYANAGPLPAQVNYGILYGTEKEARAECEVKAYVAGLYARYRLTGKLFVPDEITNRMHRVYMLDAAGGDLDQVDDAARSDVMSIKRVGTPPHFMAIEFGGWAEDAFPELLVKAA